MSPRIAITKRFKGLWCHRSRIWYPEPKLPHSDHASVQVEGPLSDQLGAFLLAVIMHSRFIDKKMLLEMVRMTKLLRARNKRVVERG